MNKKIFTVLAILILSLNASANEDLLKKWQEFSNDKVSKSIPDWLKLQASAYLKGEKEVKPPGIKIPEFYGYHGIFITLILDKKVRGCYGSFYPESSDFYEVSSQFMKSALRDDPRYKPLSLSDIQNIDVVVTIASRPVAENDINLIDISRKGVLIQYFNGENFVLVPEEIRTTDYFLKKINRAKVAAIYSFDAVTIKN